MPPSRKKRKSAPPVTATDHISALPDQMLHHVLSFLPVQAAVQTCVLARRWRHLWKSTTGLRVVGLDDDGFVAVQDIRKFMHHLLVLRERTHLDTVEIKLDLYDDGDDDDDDDDDDDVRYVNLWTRFAVMCKVRALTLHIDDNYLALDDLPLVCRRLETLDLQGVALGKAFLDFASCPALKTLKMNDCEINAERISSSSLKHLSIICCRSNSYCRVRVSAPGLVSLKLEGFIGITPFLEGMALLEAACVNLDDQCQDVCLNYDTGVFCGANNNTCKYCFPINDDCSSDCVLLGGISNAKHLELISEIGMGPNHEVEMEGSYCCMERPSAISEHLNIVEVKCDVVDKRILKILRFLCAFNIRKLTNDTLHILRIVKLASICQKQSNRASSE